MRAITNHIACPTSCHVHMREHLILIRTHPRCCWVDRWSHRARYGAIDAGWIHLLPWCFGLMDL